MQPGIDYTWMFLKMVGVLGLLILIMLLVVRYLLPLITRRGMIGKGAKGFISILQRFPLEPRKNIYLLKVAGKVLLVGATDHSINLLSEVPRENVET